jgi:CheY-like chemotaxis protein/anti-sigma regulatory factor (Ser/Thr protein kinase)
MIQKNVVIDEKLMRQVLYNLVSNSLKYSFHETVVEVKVSLISNQLHVVVKDKGIGIPEKYLQEGRIFEAFVRADNVGNVSGTGLGMAIIKNAVDLQNGTIHVESTQNIGTKNISDNSNYDEGTKMIKYKVLVIEDEDLVREGIVLILQVNGYDVYTANNGRKGVDEAKKVIPDLIISDVMMPELDGYGVLEELRGTRETSTIPFLFLTAKADKSDHKAGYEFRG